MMNLSEERILDFLDGRLATPDEEELLHTLAVSPERRQVLRAHIRLRELTNNLAKQERFTVPETVTDQLFSRLEEAGFSAPSMPESMVASASHTPFAAPLAGTAGAGVIATAVSTGWRFGMMGLVAASVMSFVLGAGAYYVFGSSLGLRTRSQELAALKHASPHGIAAATLPASQAAISSPLAIVDNSAGNSSTTVGGKNISHNTVSENTVSPISQVGPIGGGNAEMQSAVTPSQVPASGNSDIASTDNTPAIGLTAPRELTYELKKDKMQYLNGPGQILPNAIPAPYSIDRGTISVRYGFGPGPSSTTAPMSSLTEFRIGWTMWNYVLWRASMGQMEAYGKTSQLVNTATGYQAITSESNSAVSSTVVGLETGLTLDPLGMPIDILGGFMYAEGATNSSSFVGRASLMAHFEPWKLMEVSAGLEGVWYSHSLTVASPIVGQQYQSAFAVKQPNPSSEVVGLVGPAIEIGWHF